MTQGATSLLLVTHGTRDARGTAASVRLADEIARRLPGVVVRLAFADVRAPGVGSVLSELARDDSGAAADVVVVPAFLASGYHVRIDLPGQLARIGALSRVRLTPALGAHSELVAASADRLRAAGWRAGDTVVLGAAGSSDPGARAEVRQAARELGRQLDTSVRVGYLTGRPRRLVDVVAGCTGGGRVAVASWLLAPGFFQDRVATCGAQVCAEPLAGHSSVIDVVVARYLWALGERSVAA